MLGRFAEARLAGMPDDELAAFERLLALPDPELHAWFSRGATAADAGEFAELIVALRAHHGLAPIAAEGVESQ